VSASTSDHLESFAIQVKAATISARLTVVDLAVKLRTRTDLRHTEANRSIFGYSHALAPNQPTADG
jgi:hypothetical protein